MAPSTPPQPKNARSEADDDLLVAVAAGHVVFSEGDAGGDMYIVESGEIEIVKRVHGGREHRLAVLEAGDFFGEMSLLEGRPRNATARCLSDARLLTIDAATFDRILRQHPEITIRILRSLVARLREFEEAEQRARQVAAGVLAGVEDSPSVLTPIDVAPAPPPMRLVHRESGREFPLPAAPEILIGRFDPSTGGAVDVDLSAVDAGRSVSRIHARIRQGDGHYFLREEIGTSNGTWVGRERLTSGKEHEIRPGDRLRLGRVDFVFDRATAAG